MQSMAVQRRVINVSRYDILQTVLHWCKTHNRRDFYYYEVNIPSQQLAMLCRSGYRRKKYIEKKGRSPEKGFNYRLWRYGLVDGIDIDEVI